MDLYRKHRPKLLKHLEGNEQTKKAISELLKGDLPKSIILHGPSGCGKTTLARIIANKIGCQTLFEINAGNTTGIDKAREIEENAKFPPFIGNSKFWIIDECQKSSASFWNCMLKPLEDSPEFCYFILCTTEPDAIPHTIKTRCMAFKMEPLSDTEIERVITRVIELEHSKVDKKAIDEIVLKADGSGRQALVMLDQIIRLPFKEQLAAAQNIKSESAQMIDLCRALMKEKELMKIIPLLGKLKDADPEGLRRMVLKYFTSVFLGCRIEADAAKCAFIMEAFKNSTWQNGFAGIVTACTSILYEGD